MGEIMMKRRGEWFATKDLGRKDVDGFYYHGGRADDVIITAGYTMGAVEIEDMLLKHADVDEAAVIGVPDEERGQVVKAFVVSKREGGDDFTADIQAFTQERLSRHEYPRIVQFVDSLPKTPPARSTARPSGTERQKHERHRPAALFGVRVIEMSGKGPVFCAMLLADMGADVIH